MICIILEYHEHIMICIILKYHEQIVGIEEEKRFRAHNPLFRDLVR